MKRSYLVYKFNNLAICLGVLGLLYFAGCTSNETADDGVSRHQKALDKDAGEPIERDEPIAQDTCSISGCNGEICSEEPMSSICLARPQHVCYAQSFAVCEKQADQKCGWSRVAELNQCIGEKLFPNRVACAERTGGAFVEFQIGPETMRVWVTNNDFIDEAIELKNSQKRRVPLFSKLVEGADCDLQYAWTVDPEKLSFADATIELCDGRPSFINDDLNYWVYKLGTFCPWSAEVIHVEDRR